MTSQAPSPAGAPAYEWIQTSSHIVSLEAFYGIIWMFISLCLLAFAVRLYIRYHCFRKLLTDDYIMMFSFVLLAAVAGTGQAYIKDIYYVVDLENGRQLPDATTPKRMQDGLRSFGAEMIMSVIGITAVKINFLFFFKRLGTQITSYLVFWWICLVIVVGCGAVNLGLLDYKCVYADLQYTFMHCTQRSTLKRYFNFQKVSVSLDVVSDVFIIIFPVVILWNVRISLRKRIILSCTFGLVALTIAVTIVRGSVFGGTYKEFDNNEKRNLNPGWMFFWLYIEFAVAFLIACIVSFRALFAQRENRAYANQARLQPVAFHNLDELPSSKKSSGLLRRAKYYHDSLLQSFKTLETVNDMRLPEPESGRFSPTFLTVFGDDRLPTQTSDSMGESVGGNSGEYEQKCSKP